MLRVLTRLVFAVLAIVGLVALVAVAALASGGISARSTPGRLETSLARGMRSMAIPRDARDLKSPTRQTPDTLRLGMEHFADHCATCHANDGSGNTEMGRGLYPPPPDMRQRATQDLTDGELFYIIENGVRFTGMPAWGAGSGEAAEESWHLVQFIRHLPKLTQADQEEMKELNPRTLAEWQQLGEEQRQSGKRKPAHSARPHKH